MSKAIVTETTTKVVTVETGEKKPEIPPAPPWDNRITPLPKENDSGFGIAVAGGVLGCLALPALLVSNVLALSLIMIGLGLGYIGVMEDKRINKRL